MGRYILIAEIIVDAPTEDHAKAAFHDALKTMDPNMLHDYGLDVEYYD